jgi:hypothetical protein
MNQLDRSFNSIRGKPCWGVKRGYAGFLTLEFGKPHLSIQEPAAVTPTWGSAQQRKRWARRVVTVRGQWHLWIHSCDWLVRNGSQVVGDSTSARRMDRAANFLNGQKLIAAQLARRGARTVFEFDLGGQLETKPFDRMGEQWLLFEPSGKVLTLRADRKFAYASGGADPKTEQWRSLAV